MNWFSSSRGHGKEDRLDKLGAGRFGGECVVPLEYQEGKRARQNQNERSDEDQTRVNTDGRMCQCGFVDSELAAQRQKYPIG